MESLGFLFSSFFIVVYLAGAVLVVYVLILLVQVLRLSILALKKYLRQ